MKVKCINNGHLLNMGYKADLTIGKEYTVLDVDDQEYKIIDDNGHCTYYNMQRFEKIVPKLNLYKIQYYYTSVKTLTILDNKSYCKYKTDTVLATDPDKAKALVKAKVLKHADDSMTNVVVYKIPWEEGVV